MERMVVTEDGWWREWLLERLVDGEDGLWRGWFVEKMGCGGREM